MNLSITPFFTPRRKSSQYKYENTTPKLPLHSVDTFSFKGAKKEFFENPYLKPFLNLSIDDSFLTDDIETEKLWQLQDHFFPYAQLERDKVTSIDVGNFHDTVGYFTIPSLLYGIQELEKTKEADAMLSRIKNL